MSNIAGEYFSEKANKEKRVHVGSYFYRQHEIVKSQISIIA